MNRAAWLLSVCVLLGVAPAVAEETGGPTINERIEAAGLKVRLAMAQGDYGAWVKAQRELLQVADSTEQAWHAVFAEESKRGQPKMDRVRDAQQAIAQLAAMRAGLRWGQERAAYLSTLSGTEGRGALRALRADAVYMASVPGGSAAEK